MILDTGSSDLYFDASSAAACQSTGEYACKGGTFDPSSSSTYSVAVPAPAFDTAFGDGSTASGPFGRDTVCISDICVDGVQFGVADTVRTTTGYSLGLMGLGYSLNEATRHQYPNIPAVLKDSGEINSRLYSVYLNDEGAMSGSILFGGLDTTKYTGPLVTLDILPNLIEEGHRSYLTSEVYQFVTTVTDLTTTVDGQNTRIFANGAPGVEAYSSSGGSLPVLLDTGSTAWSVPYNYYPAIVTQFPYIDRQGLCSCQYANSADSLTLTFGGEIQIHVPAREFIVPLYNATTAEPVPYDSNGDQACVFLIQPSQDTGFGFMTLGDAIIRSMYIVYDLDNGQVSLAQANTNSTEAPNIKVVEAGPNGVQKAVNGDGKKYVPAAASQSLSIAAPLSATAKFHVSTATTTIGTATGTAAVQRDAQPTASGAASAVGMPVGVPTAAVLIAGWTILMLGLGPGGML